MALPCSRAQTLQDKVSKILMACDTGCPVDDLIAFCTSDGGLVEDKVRRQACMPRLDRIVTSFLTTDPLGPILLNCQPVTQRDEEGRRWRSLPRHNDEDQVRLDVDRSFVYYPKGENEEQLGERKLQLSELITRVLRGHPGLCYFQGYHDIAQVFLLVLGLDAAPPALVNLSFLRIRDFVLPSLAPSIAQLNLLPAILQAEAPGLHRHLATAQPLFALSATLTLYAHEIQEYGDIARLFDFFLAHPAIESIYLFAAIVLSRSKELFEIPSTEPEMLHSTLSKLPRPLDLEHLISETTRIFTAHPPECLPVGAWWRVSRYSVLRTTRTEQIKQTLEDGEKLFVAHSRQLHRQQVRGRVLRQIAMYRPTRPYIALAIGVAAFAIWLKYK